MACGGVAGADANGVLCPSCWQETRFLTGASCDRCALPLDVTAYPEDLLLCEDCAAEPPPWQRARAVVLYEGGGRSMVLALKSLDRTAAALPMGRWMAEKAQGFASPDMVLPVPLHWTRRASRRYNQSAELSRVVARHLDVPFRPDVLRRMRRTEPQGYKTWQERQRNVSGAFAVVQATDICGKSLILVDDVLTTGATARASTRTLLQAGCRRVDLLTFARVAREAEGPV